MKKILLLHGALGTKEQFKKLKSVLEEKHQVYDLDFEGHGSFFSDKEFSMSLFVKNVVDFLEKNEIDKINIFGYSMGGYVALNTAIQYPHVVEKIMTLGTKFNWTKEAATQEIKMLNPVKIKEKVPAFAQHLEKIHQNNSWESVLNRTVRMMTNLGTKNKLEEKDLVKIFHPVLISLGEKDKMVTLEESKKSVDVLPQGIFKIIEDTPHPIEKIDAQKLAKIVFDFI